MWMKMVTVGYVRGEGGGGSKILKELPFCFSNNPNIFPALQQTPPPKGLTRTATFNLLKGRHLGVWESQKIFAKIFPKNAHKPHFYVQLTMFCRLHIKTFYQIDFWVLNLRKWCGLKNKKIPGWAKKWQLDGKNCGLKKT